MALAGLALAGLALIAGCGGSSTTKSFRVEVPAGATPNDLFQSALAHAVDLCAANPKVLQVTWTFSKTDSDNPIVVEYQKTPYPQRQDCSAVRQSVDNGILSVDSTTTTKGK